MRIYIAFFKYFPIDPASVFINLVRVLQDSANSLIVMAPLAFLFVALAAVSTQAYAIHEESPATSEALTTEILPQAQFTMSFSGRIARSKGKQEALRTMRKRSSSYTTVLAGGLSDQEYLTDITIGGQEFKVEVDTGS